MLDQDATIYAHCDRSGLITFSAEPDHDGLICLGSGDRAFRDTVTVRARHSYSGELLVPGVPEAASDGDALIAVQYFTDVLGGMSCAEADELHDIDGVRTRALNALTASAA